jgi:hypothetical protein
MVHVFIRHRVKDYGAWRRVFDGFAAKRRVGGGDIIQDRECFRKPNNLCLFFEWQSVAKAKEFSGIPGVGRGDGASRGGREAGVIGSSRRAQSLSWTGVNRNRQPHAGKIMTS